MSEEEKPRVVMFFEADVRGAADTAAFAMERHGLSVSGVDELRDRLGDVIRAFFAARAVDE